MVENGPNGQKWSKMVKDGGPDLKRAQRTGLSARRARRTKSRGPKGLQPEVRALRAPRLLVHLYFLSIVPNFGPKKAWISLSGFRFFRLYPLLPVGWSSSRGLKIVQIHWEPMTTLILSPLSNFLTPRGLKTQHHWTSPTEKHPVCYWILGLSTWFGKYLSLQYSLYFDIWCFLLNLDSQHLWYLTAWSPRLRTLLFQKKKEKMMTSFWHVLRSYISHRSIAKVANLANKDHRSSKCSVHLPIYPSTHKTGTNHPYKAQYF